jgi:hypothetical protein
MIALRPRPLRLTGSIAQTSPKGQPPARAAAKRRLDFEIVRNDVNRDESVNRES